MREDTSYRISSYVSFFLFVIVSTVCVLAAATAVLYILWSTSAKTICTFFDKLSKMGNTNRGQTVDKQIESNVLPSFNSPSHRSAFLNDRSIDQYILIWLDGSSQENSLHSMYTRALLKGINNGHCLFFDQIDLCLSTIVELQNENKKMLVVISPSFAKEVLFNLSEIATVIIFCRDYNKNNDLAKKYSNVTDICTDYETLKNCIERELPSLKLNLFTNRKYKFLRSLTASQGIGHSGAYFSYMSFIDLLKRMPQTRQTKETMLNKCKDYYRKDDVELKRIEEFQNKYTSNKAVDWYVKDSFVYRIVNLAFRTEDVSLWYLFRYYIIDLCTQLEEIHKEQNNQTSFTVYRGQADLPTNELEILQSNIGGLISTYGFLSTSTTFDIARSFILGAKDTKDSKVAFFQITVDAFNRENIIFVDIDKYIGQAEGEGEVLFSIDSVFKVESVNYDFELGAWKIEMKATDQGTKSIKDQIDTTRKRFQNCSINLLFGRLLLDTGQYSKAESYFQMILQILPKSHEDLSSVYDHIGDLNMQKTNWNEALKHFNLAYEIKKKRLHFNHPDISATLDRIGNYYKTIGDNVQALEHHRKALQCQIDQYNTAVTLVNIGTIHTINKNYGEALNLSLKACLMLQQMNPCPHAAVIYCQCSIGDIYLALHDYNIAEDFYFVAFEMCKAHLFIDDYQRFKCVKALANFYHQQNMNKRAVDLCLDQLSLYELHLDENHTSIANLLMIIAELCEDDDEQKIKSLERALGILYENVHRECATTASCLMMMAEYYQKQNEIEIALKYYIQAIEIQKKIYPKNHLLATKAQGLINALDTRS